MNRFRAILITVATSATLIGHAHASVVFSHAGNSDPETNGWAVEPSFAPGGRPTSGPVSDDQGSGLDAWFIDDNLQTIGSNWFYTQTPSSTEISQASTLGWTLRANLRIVDAPDAISNAGSIMLEYATDAVSFRLALGSAANGDPITLLSDGGTDGDNNTTGEMFTYQNGGSGYHLYEMVYDPVASSVDLFIDGIERISDFSGILDPTFKVNRVAWGSGSSFDVGQSNWNQVEWEIATVPLPASLPLFFTGLVGLLGWARRSRRTSP